MWRASVLMIFPEMLPGPLAQSLAGKTAVSVARLCKDLNVPCIALAGALGPGHERAHLEGLTAAFPIQSGPMSLDESMRHAAPLLTAATVRVLRTFTVAAG